MELMNDSRKLLEDYAKHGSEAAFRELVARHVNMVHSTARRLVNGDSHLAEDVTQTVFLNLARKAGELTGEVMIGGWLHRNACFVASTVMRGNRRRQNRERKAVEMNATEDHSAANFAEAAPLLDDAINQLGPEDRAAILLRFFEQLEFRAVAEMMGSNEDAARMRVNRALDKLHSMLTQRGVALSAAALGTTLAAEAVSSAPVGMAVSVATAALGGAVTGGSALTIIKIMSISKIKIAIVSAIAAALLAVPVVVQQKENKALRQQNEALRQQVAQTASLQEQLARLSQDAAKATAAALAQEAQTRELARLRNEVAQLRGQTNELANARQEIQMLNERTAQVEDRSKPGTSSPANPSDLSGIITNENRRVDLCVGNLRQIDSAKQQWALENKKQITDTPTMKDLIPYIGQGPGIYMPVCPDGGDYTIGTVGEKPTCSNPKHVLP
jgi:RNA polymerase sigma factor (sigma-70 family)